MPIENTVSFEGKHFVYAVLCRDGDGPLYVKFGKTGNLHKRLRVVGGGTPIPAKWFAFVPVPQFRKDRIERALHCVFSKRKVRGEWFRFDADSSEDRQEFNRLSQSVFKLHLGKDVSWDKVSVSALDAWADHRRRQFLRSGGKKKAEQQQRRAAAWKELDSYGTA